MPIVDIRLFYNVCGKSRLEMETNSKTQLSKTTAVDSAVVDGFGLVGTAGIVDAMIAQTHVEEADADVFTQIGAGSYHPAELTRGFVAEGLCRIAVLADEK